VSRGCRPDSRLQYYYGKDIYQKRTIQKEINNNSHNICKKFTSYWDEFLDDKIPGENRKEQLNHIANILEIPIINDLITPVFYKGNR
jgi:hypothetical protein